MSVDFTNKHGNTWSEVRVPRREALKVAGALLLSGLPCAAQGQTKRTKKVIVAGAGIAGLSCAYELVRGERDVTVLEASEEELLFPLYRRWRPFHEKFCYLSRGRVLLLNVVP